MCALFKSATLTQATGSVGGVTFANSKSGLYMRARSQPINRNSSAQQAIRTYFGNLAAFYSQNLTAPQRAGWDTYAKNVLMRNPLGDSVQIPAVSQFIRSNTSRLQAGLGQLNDAPTVFNIGAYTAPVLSVVSIAGPPASVGISVAFNASDDWNTGTGGGLLVYVGRPQNQSKSFFKGPYQFAGLIPSGSTSPVVLASPFAVPATSLIPYRVNVSQPDGRLGQDIMDTVTTGVFVVSIEVTSDTTAVATLSSPALWQNAQTFGSDDTAATSLTTTAANTVTPSATVDLAGSGMAVGDHYTIGGNFGLAYGGLLQDGLTGQLVAPPPSTVLAVTNVTATTATVDIDVAQFVTIGDVIVTISLGSVNLVASAGGWLTTIPVTGANTVGAAWIVRPSAAPYLVHGTTGVVA